MVRFVFTYVLPLVLPTLLYFLWMVPAIRRARRAGRPYPVWEETPWLILLGLGVVLLAAILFFLADHDGGAPWVPYVPPHMEDGVLVPGRIGTD